MSKSTTDELVETLQVKPSKRFKKRPSNTTKWYNVWYDRVARGVAFFILVGFAGVGVMSVVDSTDTVKYLIGVGFVALLVHVVIYKK